MKRKKLSFTQKQVSEKKVLKTIRNMKEKIIFHIHKEQVRRYVNKNLENFIESKMDIRLDS